jgi:hypothetical protein
MPSRTAHNVAFLNRSSVVSDGEAERMMAALQVQASRDFAKVWGIDVRLRFVPSGDTTSWKGAWNLLLLDTSDEADALGYHDLTPEGRALGKVFAKTTLVEGCAVSVCASHELLEMLLDPYVNLTSFDPERGIFVAYEASDAVETDECGYLIDGVLVSDFVSPAFFDPTAAERSDAVFSFKGHVHRPFELAEGGYETVYVPGRGWTQYSKRAAARALDRPRVGSRRERRAFRWAWQHSEP